MVRELRDTKLIIDLEKIKKNIEVVKNIIGPDVAFMPVIKANGYGHGAVGIAPAIMETKPAYLAVATLSEAVELKEAYPDYPVFVMGHTPDQYLPYAVEYGIALTVFDLSQVTLLGRLASEAGKTATVHVKVDTGFHRLGKMPSPDYTDEVCAMFDVDAVNIEGIFSHLALANDEENDKQYDMFCDFIEEIEQRGYEFKYKHIADSIATVDYPQYHMNMVRPGAIIYGMKRNEAATVPVEPALVFKTAISQLHEIKAGEGVSYDYLWKAERDSIVATLPFGYADGYPRNLRDKGYVVIAGIKCPVVGVICMDQCIADVTELAAVTDVHPGMEAIIYGDGSETSMGAMTIAEAASLAGSNKNEIIARIPARPQRIYI